MSKEMLLKMSGRLFLGYYANEQGMIGEVVRISTDAPFCPKIKHRLKGLYPPLKVKNDFLGGRISWDDYITEYIKKLTSDPQSKIDLDFVKNMLDEGKDVTLLCYCVKPPCHKFILGELFFKMGYPVYYFVQNDEYKVYTKNLYGLID